MIRLIRRRLIIPRGDTGSFSIPTIGEVSESDVAIFGIFDPLTHKTLIMKKIQATSPFLTITFSSEDTINLEPRKYNWDITIYKSPQYDEEGELIGATEVNSYYSAFKLPICEITEAALDMNKDRWKTSTLTLETNNYQASNSIQTVYPWEKIQRSQLSKQIIDIARDYGFEKEEPDFWSRFTSGTVIFNSIEELPIEGQEDTLYCDRTSGKLYYYKIISGEITEEMREAISAIIVSTEEVEEQIINKVYLPIYALPIIKEDDNG